jgi:hypothetical protein
MRPVTKCYRTKSSLNLCFGRERRRGCSRQGAAMTDWELWACANQLRKQHGNDALEVAAKRLDAMLEADDREGYWVWCQILTRISKLGPVVPEGTTAN